MIKFIKTIIFFTIPLLIISITTYRIDPFNIIRQEKNDKLSTLKEELSYKINYPLYKIQQYFYEPTEIIVLGDSRANHLSEKNFEKIAKEKTSNLAYGGGTMEEIIETFWTAKDIHQIEKVYIGINFNLYNAFNLGNRVKEANSLRQSKTSYLTSKFCLKSTFLLMKSLITNEEIKIETPPFSREAFWKHQLEVSVPNFYTNYKYPIKYFQSLKQISDFCAKNHIELVLFIPPTHVDLQDKINDFNLQKDYEVFKNDLVSLSDKVFDFNFENEMTTDKNHFTDPFHFDENYEKIIIEVISSDSTAKYSNLFKMLRASE